MKPLIPVLLLAGLSFLPMARADDTPAATGEDYLSDCHDASDADDYKSVIDTCTSALQAGGLESAQIFMAYLYRGMAHHGLNENDAAVADYTEAMAAAPDHTDTDFAHFERGAAYSDDGQYDKALADFDAAVKLKPEEATYRMMRGNAYFDLDRDTDALTDLSQAIALNPKDAGAFAARGVIQLMQGDYAAAIADYSQVLQLAPDDASSRTPIGEGYYFLGKYPEALAEFDADLAKQPADDYAMAWRYLSAQRAGQDGGKTLMAQVDAMTDHSRWTYLLGQFYLGKTGSDQVLAAARGATTDAVLQKQVLCQADTFIAEFYRNSGKPGAAAPLFREALQLCQHNSIGRIMAQRGLAAPKKAKKG